MLDKPLIVLRRWQFWAIILLLMANIFSASFNTISLSHQDAVLCASQERTARQTALSLSAILVRLQIQEGASPDSPQIERLRFLGELYADEAARRVTC